MSKVEDILVEFGIKLEQDLQDSLYKAVNRPRPGRKSTVLQPRLSGKIKSLPIIHKGDLTTYILQMPEYGKALDKGRRKTKETTDGTMRAKIEDWVMRRGLAKDEKPEKGAKPSKMSKATFEKKVKQIAFLIARKIHKHGYEGNLFFTKVITDGRLEQLKQDIIEASKTDILISIEQK